jgi:hypothetical protein
MDELKPEFWAQQWAAFWSAPAIMGPLLLIVGFVVWWVRGKMTEAQILTLKERLNFAFDLVAASDREFEKLQKDLEKLQKELQDYKAKVAIEGRNASQAKVDAAIVKVTSDNTEIRKKLFDALMAAHKTTDLPRGMGMPDPNG